MGEPTEADWERAREIAGAWWDSHGVVVRGSSPHPLDQLADAISDYLADDRERARAPFKAIVDELEDDEAIGIPPHVPLLIEALRAAVGCTGPITAEETGQ